jgi:hypothetical protein
LLEFDIGKGAELSAPVPGMEVAPLGRPEIPVGPEFEVAFVNGKGGELVEDTGAAVLKSEPLPDEDEWV